MASEDSVYKLSRAGARVDWKAAAKLVEEDGSMDECYKAVLLRHLNGRDDEENTNKCDVIGEKRKTDALNKTHSLVRDAKCARCSAPLNMHDGKYLEVGNSSKPVPSDVIVRKGNPGPFVPAVQHRICKQNSQITDIKRTNV